MTIRKYDVTATREGRWWVLTVEGVGVTQSRNLRDAPAQAVDLVAAVLDIDADQVRVVVTPQLEDPSLLEEARKTRANVAALARTQRDIAAQSRHTVRALHDAGLSGVDIGAVLGVTDKRVSQLLASGEAESHS